MSYIKITLDEIGPIEKFGESSGAEAQIRVQVERLVPAEVPPMMLSACVDLIEKSAKVHGTCKGDECPFVKLYIPLAKEIKERSMQFDWSVKLKKPETKE